MSKLRLRGSILAGVALLYLCSPYRAAVVPPFYIDSVVAIGHDEPVPGSPGVKWVPEASGFLYGDFLSKQGDQNQYAVYLVTNRHVLLDHTAASSSPLSVKFNSQSQVPAREFKLSLQDERGRPAWQLHPDLDVDVAVTRLNAQFLRNEGAKFSFFRSDSDILSREKAKEIGLSEGDQIFVLGFPMGLVDGIQDYVVVRQGAIARVRDRLDSPTVKTFLIDSFIFPGSSGSPVVLKPEMLSIEGTKPPIQRAYLIGVVQGFIPYVDTAVSLQTRRPRVTFEENSGLAKAVAADYIQETIEAYKQSHP